MSTINGAAKALAAMLAVSLFGLALGQGYSLAKAEVVGPQATSANDFIKWQTVSFTPENILITESNQKFNLDYALSVKTSALPASVAGNHFEISITAALSLPKYQGQLQDQAKITVTGGPGATVNGGTPIEFSAMMVDTWQNAVTKNGQWDGEVYLNGDSAEVDLSVTWTSAGGTANWQGGIRWKYVKGAPTPDEHLPIVFIPGVAGSELDDARQAGHELWPVKYNPKADRLDLALDKTGAAGKVPIEAPDVIRSVWGTDFYASFLGQLASWGYREGDNLILFPYDWRLDNRTHAAKLDQVINALRMRTGKSKVILITHSMGGLLARYYLTHGGAGKVAKHIAISPPNRGSAKVYYAYIMGYTFGNPFVNVNTMKFLFPNLPAGYELMPFDPFIFDVADWRAWSLPEAFSVWYRGVDWVKEGIPDTWQLSSDFNWQFNDLLETQARDFQLSLGASPAAGVEMHSIIGWGIPTVSRFEAYRADTTRKGSRGGATRKPDGTISNFAPGYETGDSTVPLSSLEGIKGDQKYYIRDVPGSSGEHTGIMGNPTTWAIVKGILDGKVKGPGDLPGIALAPPDEAFRTASPDDPFTFSIYCPANLHVYDAGNHHLGLNAQGAVEEQIPSSSFLQGDDEQFAAIGRPSGTYRVQIDCTGDGVLTLSVSLGTGSNKRAIEYKDVPIHKGDVLTLDVKSPEGAMSQPEDLVLNSTGSISKIKAQAVASRGQPPAAPPTPPTPPALPPKPIVAGADNPGWTQTLAYHQLTNFIVADSLQVANGQEPRISANGKRIVFSINPAPGDSAKRSRVGVVDTDGGNLSIVDSSDAPPMLDISADGNALVSEGYSELRFVRLGQAPRLLLMDSEIGTVRISADGQEVFFCQNRDFVLQGSNVRLERGIYAIRTDGSSLRKIAGAAEVCQMLGVSANNLATLSSSSRGSTVDVSTDGSRVVFLANVQTPTAQSEVFTVNGDGSGLREIAEATQCVGAVGISGDGSRIAWASLMNHTSHFEGWTSLFDGSRKAKLSDYPGEDRSISLTQDGSKVLFGAEATLYSTDGRERTLLAPLRNGPNAGWFYETRLHSLTMSHDGTIFSYGMDNPAGYQLAVIQLNPPSFGLAPQITGAFMQPEAVTSDPNVLITVKARVECATPIVGGLVSAIFFTDGLLDGSIGYSSGLHDVHGDHIYTDTGIHGTPTTAAGSRRLRIKAETALPDGRRHATIVEIDPSGQKG